MQRTRDAIGCRVSPPGLRKCAGRSARQIGQVDRNKLPVSVEPNEHSVVIEQPPGRGDRVRELAMSAFRYVTQREGRVIGGFDVSGK
jgi:hypothetical protein